MQYQHKHRCILINCSKRQILPLSIDHTVKITTALLVLDLTTDVTAGLSEQFTLAFYSIFIRVVFTLYLENSCDIFNVTSKNENGDCHETVCLFTVLYFEMYYR